MIYTRIYRTILAFLFVAALVSIAVNWFGANQRLHEFPTVILVIIGLAFVGYVFRLPSDKPIYRNIWPAIIMTLGALFFVPFLFIWQTFGTADFGSLLTTIKENPPGEMVQVGLGSLGQPIREHVAILIVLIIGGFEFSRRVPYFGYFIALVGAMFIAISPVTYYAYRAVIPSPYHKLLDLEADLTPPTVLTRPTHLKNVVYVYLESVERTYRDIPDTADAFEPLAKFEDEGLSFDQLFNSYGLHFTAGGIVGSQCGVPLLPNGILNVHKKIHDDKNNAALELDGFMNNVECLGDILSEDGYIGSYMNGSDLAVFSKGDIFLSHGWERAFGVNSLGGTRAETYENVWGLNDDTLFEYAHKELEFLADTGRPFMMAMLTIATHGPDAELDEGCDYPQVADSYIPAAIYCTGKHVEGLLEKLDELGIRDDTIVVLLSDHLAMHNTVKGQLQQANQDRRNYASILGAGESGVVSKVGNAMDLYPTVLELMGYTLADGRGNMGVSLLNDAPGLISRTKDPEDLSRAFEQNIPLQRLLWDGVIE